MSDFSGRVAIVTGGTRGIGLGIARELLSRGATLCLTARKEEELSAIAAELDPDRTGTVLTSRGSADDVEHQRETVERVVDRFGRLDILVNNAAVNPHYGPLMDIDLAVLRKIMEVNVVAVVGWAQLAWSAAMRRCGGSILNIASVGGIRSGSPIGGYNTSKAAVIHLTRQLALELAPGTRVNAIAPAVVKTSFARALFEDRETEVAAGYPMQRLGTPQDTAKLAAFLLSDDASWITGETVVIDGGITVAGGV